MMHNFWLMMTSSVSEGIPGKSKFPLAQKTHVKTKVLAETTKTFDKNMSTIINLNGLLGMHLFANQFVVGFKRFTFNG